MSSTDQIQKKVLLRAPLERVWQAISDSTQFGTWFGMRFDGPFVVGRRVIGKIAPTAVDTEVAAMQRPHKGKASEWFIERIEPMRIFSFRWHPYAIDPAIDYSREPTTLVTFELKEEQGGTFLTVTESGFDRIPLDRRARAFAANDGGWTHQVRLIEKYLAMNAQG